MNAREKMSFLYGLYLAHDRSENHTEKFMTSFELMVKAEFPEWNFPAEEDESEN
jgi:hypothetical protein